MNIRCGRQITHGRFQGLVPHPVLDGSYVETPPEHAGGIRGPEGLQIKFFRIETGDMALSCETGGMRAPGDEAAAS